MKRIHGIQSEIIAHKGDEVVLKLYNDIDIEKAKQKAVDGRYLTVLDFYEKDSITDLQRKHYFALIGDYKEYTGTPEQAADSYFRYNFMQEQGLDEYPSLARNRMKKTVATELITWLIEFMVQNEIPFRKQQFYLTADTSRMLFALTMKRICWVCGKKHSHLHHYDAVQRGHDRTKIDHTKHRFMMLCADHHQEIHNLGNKAFCEKYILSPIKLDKKNLKELNIRGNYEG